MKRMSYRSNRRPSSRGLGETATNGARKGAPASSAPPQPRTCASRNRAKASGATIGIGLLLLCLAAPASAARHDAASVRRGAQRDTSAARPTAAPRRLEDIHIEGEIPAPQVLFITARDQRRFTRFHHRRYLKSALQVGEETPLPARITTTRDAAAPAREP